MFEKGCAYIALHYITFHPTVGAYFAAFFFHISQKTKKNNFNFKISPPFTYIYTKYFSVRLIFYEGMYMCRSTNYGSHLIMRNTTRNTLMPIFAFECGTRYSNAEAK